MFMKVDPLILKIEQELERRGWSKSDFCQRLEISTQTYNHWRGRGAPSRRLSDVAALFGWDVGQLLRGAVGVKEESGVYDSLTPAARSLAKRWQALPEQCKKPVLELLDSLEALAKTRLRNK